MGNYYIKEHEFFYEIVLSKGKGKLTKRAEEMLILLANRTFGVKAGGYNNNDDRLDCYQTGMLHLFKNWKSFNEKKFSQAMPYFTEVFKRGLADGWGIITNNKKNYDNEKIRYVSIDGANDGKGSHLF